MTPRLPAFPARPPAGSGQVVVATGGAGDRALISAAIERCRTPGGQLDGAVAVRGRARLASELVVDLGYHDVTPADANWQAATPERFALRGDFAPDPGLPEAITVHGGFGAQLGLRFHGGGASGEVNDGAITAAQNTLTSAAAVAAGVTPGCVVRVYGAGPQLGVGRLPLSATVRAVAGNVLTLSDTAGATVAGARVVWLTTALRLEDVVGVDPAVWGKNYAGCLYAADAAGDATRRVRNSAYRGVLGLDVGMTVFHKKIEAFGSLGDVQSVSLYGSVFDGCDDHSWTKFEGGVGALDGGGARHDEVYLDIINPNNWQPGPITVGDRASVANVRISGGDAGSAWKIRATGALPGGAPAIALQLNDVNSIDADLQTKDAPIGVDVVGGGQNGGAGASPASGIALRHHSLSNDDVPIRVRPSDTQTAPNIRVLARHRRCNAQAVKIEAGLTGGRLVLDGTIDQFNTGNSAIPGGQCDSAAFVVELAPTFRQERRGGATTAGWTHADPAKLKVRRGAFLGDATVHGKAPALWQNVAALSAPPGIADGFVTDHGAVAFNTNLQNDSPFRLIVTIPVRFQPTAAAPSPQLDVVTPAPTAAGLVVNPFTQERFDASGADGATVNDLTRLFTVEVPPWHWWRLNASAAGVSIGGKVAWRIE